MPFLKFRQMVQYHIKKYACFLFVIISMPIIGQEEAFTIPDSLADKSYEYLFSKMRRNYKDTITSLIYLKTSLTKATQEDNKRLKAITFNTLSAYENDKSKKIKLIENAIIEAENIESSELIPVYLNIGYTYNSYYELEKALIYYIKASDLAEKFNIEIYKYILIENIAKVKERIGKHDEALILYKKSLDYTIKKRSKDTIKRIGNIINIAESFRNNKKYDSASYYYNNIVDEAYRQHLNYGKILTINEGINLYYKKEYSKAEELLINGALNLQMHPYSEPYYILSQLYLGKIQEIQSNDPEKAKLYYSKVDSILSKTKLVLPEASTAYDFLISYYKKKKDYKNQLDITNKYLELKTIISSRDLKTTNILHDDFDTPQLLNSKQILIDELKNKTNRRTVYLSLFILLFIILFIIQYHRYKRQKEKYNNIIESLNNKENIKNNRSSKILTLIVPTQELNIDEAIITSVLKKLDVFESKNEFLQPDINITFLAKKCSTNTKYLSKIINIHKGKSFINYINDHRIDYILKELKENKTLQRYTIKSISEVAGFNTAESFASAFKKKTGIKPSYYIRNLKIDVSI